MRTQLLPNSYAESLFDWETNLRPFQAFSDGYYKELTRNIEPAGSRRRSITINIGASAVGKSTFSEQLIAASPENTVRADFDHIRLKNPTYLKALVTDGDRVAYDKAAPEVFFTFCNIINKAQRDGYNIVANLASLGTAQHILNNAGPTGYRLVANMLCAPVDVCLASMQNRAQNYGSVRRNSPMQLLFSYTRAAKIWDAIVLSKADEINAYWREKPQESPVLVARQAPRETRVTIVDNPRYEAFLRSVETAKKVRERIDAEITEFGGIVSEPDHLIRVLRQSKLSPSMKNG